PRAARQGRRQDLRPERLVLVDVRGRAPDLGGSGGTVLVAGVRWASRCKDAGSLDRFFLSGRLRTRQRGVQRGPAAQPLFRQTLLAFRGSYQARCRWVGYRAWIQESSVSKGRP